MKPDPLDPKLTAYARQRLPSCPDELTGAVWQEIARRRQSFWARLIPTLEWRELFSEPRLAATAFVCALAAGVLPAVVLAKAHEQQRLARQSVHFDVFTAASAQQLAALGPSGSTRSSRP